MSLVCAVQLDGALCEHVGHVLGHTHHLLLHEGAVQAPKRAHLGLHAYTKQGVCSDYVINKKNRIKNEKGAQEQKKNQKKGSQ